MGNQNQKGFLDSDDESDDVKKKNAKPKSSDSKQSAAVQRKPASSSAAAPTPVASASGSAALRLAPPPADHSASRTPPRKPVAAPIISAAAAPPVAAAADPPVAASPAAAPASSAAAAAASSAKALASDAIWSSVLNSLYTLLEGLLARKLLTSAHIEQPPEWLARGVLGTALLEALKRSAKIDGIQLATGPAVTMATCPPQHVPLMTALNSIKKAIGDAKLDESSFQLLREVVLAGGSREPPAIANLPDPTAGAIRAIAAAILKITTLTTALPFWAGRWEEILVLLGKTPGGAAPAPAAAPAADAKDAKKAAAAAGGEFDVRAGGGAAANGGAREGGVEIDAIWGSVLNQVYHLAELLLQKKVISSADLAKSTALLRAGSYTSDWLPKGLLRYMLLEALRRSTDCDGIRLATGPAVTFATCPPAHVQMLQSLMSIKAGLSKCGFNAVEMQALQLLALFSETRAVPGLSAGDLFPADRVAAVTNVSSQLGSIANHTLLLPFWPAQWAHVLAMLSNPGAAPPAGAAAADAVQKEGESPNLKPEPVPVAGSSPALKPAAAAAAAAAVNGARDGKDAKSAAATHWTCHACTYADNALKSSKCEMCTAARDDQKLAAKLKTERDAADAKHAAKAAVDAKGVGMDAIWDAVLNRTYHVAEHALRTDLITRAEVEDEEPFLYFGLIGATVLDAVKRSMPLPPDAIALATQRVVTLANCPPELQKLMAALVQIKGGLTAAALTDGEWDGLRKIVLWAAADGKPEVAFASDARKAIVNRAAGGIQSIVTQVTQMKVFKERFGSILKLLAENSHKADAAAAAAVAAAAGGANSTAAADGAAAAPEEN